MKRGTLVAVAILVVLLGIFFVTQEETPQYERSPMTIQKVDGLSRITIEQPAGDGSASEGADAGSKGSKRAGEETPEEIVLEKRDDTWWVIEPVESPASDSTAETIEEAFGSSIETDDLPIEASDANKKTYDLEPNKRVRLKLFRGEKKKPAVDLYVGKQISVEQTDAERTFVLEPEGNRIYRAAMSIGEFVRQPVEDFRSKQITDLDKESLTRVEWRYEDGPTMVLEKKKDSWKLVRPQVEWDLDTRAIDRAVGSLTTMTAEGFADDKRLSEIGLEPPTATVIATSNPAASKGKEKEGEKTSGGSKAKKRTVKLLVGESKSSDDDSSEYYVKLTDKPYKYKIAKYDATSVLSRLGDIRSKTPREFDKKSITEVRFPGEDRVVVRKTNDAWELIRPETEKSFNESKLEPKLSTIASLKVNGFPEIAPAEAGLTGGAERLTFETKDGQHAIVFGDKADEESGDRYVTFGDSDEVFTVTRFTYKKLHPKGEDLVGKSKKPKRGAHKMKGLPKGMGGMRKQQIMRKLKQRMGK